MSLFSSLFGRKGSSSTNNRGQREEENTNRGNNPNQTGENHKEKSGFLRYVVAGGIFVLIGFFGLSNRGTPQPESQKQEQGTVETGKTTKPIKVNKTLIPEGSIVTKYYNGNMEVLTPDKQVHSFPKEKDTKTIEEITSFYEIGITDHTLIKETTGQPKSVFPDGIELTVLPSDSDLYERVVDPSSGQIVTIGANDLKEVQNKAFPLKNLFYVEIEDDTLLYTTPNAGDDNIANVLTQQVLPVIGNADSQFATYLGNAGTPAEAYYIDITSASTIYKVTGDNGLEHVESFEQYLESIIPEEENKERNYFNLGIVLKDGQVPNGLGFISVEKGSYVFTFENGHTIISRPNGSPVHPNKDDMKEISYAIQCDGHVQPSQYSIPLLDEDGDPIRDDYKRITTIDPMSKISFFMENKKYKRDDLVFVQDLETGRTGYLRFEDVINDGETRHGSSDQEEWYVYLNPDTEAIVVSSEDNLYDSPYILTATVDIRGRKVKREELQEESIEPNGEQKPDGEQTTDEGQDVSLKPGSWKDQYVVDVSGIKGNLQGVNGNGRTTRTTEDVMIGG